MRLVIVRRLITDNLGQLKTRFREKPQSLDMNALAPSGDHIFHNINVVIESVEDPVWPRKNRSTSAG